MPTLSINDPRLLVAALFGGLCCVALIVVAVILPLMTRVSMIVEASSLLLNGIGEYIGHPRLVVFGCIILFLMLIGCCIIMLVIGASLITCSPTHSSQICQLFHR